MYVNNGDAELIVTNICISCKIRMTILVLVLLWWWLLLLNDIIGFLVGKWADTIKLMQAIYCVGDD